MRRVSQSQLIVSLLYVTAVVVPGPLRGGGGGGISLGPGQKRAHWGPGDNYTMYYIDTTWRIIRNMVTSITVHVTDKVLCIIYIYMYVLNNLFCQI